MALITGNPHSLPASKLHFGSNLSPLKFGGRGERWQLLNGRNGQKVSARLARRISKATDCSQNATLRLEVSAGYR